MKITQPPLKFKTANHIMQFEAIQISCALSPSHARSRFLLLSLCGHNSIQWLQLSAVNFIYVLATTRTHTHALRQLRARRDQDRNPKWSFDLILSPFARMDLGEVPLEPMQISRQNDDWVLYFKSCGRCFFY